MLAFSRLGVKKEGERGMRDAPSFLGRCALLPQRSIIQYVVQVPLLHFRS